MIHYEVDKKNGIVKAYIEGCEHEVQELLKRKTGIMFEELILPNRFEAEAICHPDDTFDERIGKSYARKKLLTKYNKKKLQLLKKASFTASKIEVAVDHELEKAIRTRNKHGDK